MARPSCTSAPAPVLASFCTLARMLVPLVLCSLCTGVSAYIPAWPSNDPNAVSQLAPNASASVLSMQWWMMEMGPYNETVTYQLVGEGSTGVTQGAFVHFSEAEFTNATTITPWIALISCDANATNPSALDVFTLAKQAGAKSALLYSVNSSVCIINPSFAAGFDHSMDVFITESQDSAGAIQNQFSPINATYTSFDAQLNSGSISKGSVQAPGFMVASLIAYNATTDNPEGPIWQRKHRFHARFGIILYAITGCVSALFCVVIVSGRYGPRTGDAGFGGAPGSFDGAVEDDASARAKDGYDVPLRAWEIMEARTMGMPRSGSAEGEGTRAAPLGKVDEGADGAESPGAGASGEQTAAPVVRPRPRAEVKPAAAGGKSEKDVVPDAIGRETCPICIVDFAEGDDLRVLPCEGHHRFHQECVDQWLLELSSSCPICRQDFQALETMMAASGDTDYPLEPPHMPGASRPLSTAAARFSRYLHGRGYDDTDPPMPLAPDA
ncbi:hypothetical protein B0H21DRAFT_770407 [Amylocystis lapponica]|nr:hypothetical protein B0H21DRAFT_770407 [Amylocystis lapponica]